ncbi:uncharacterized protein LOC105695372 [Orussus abietinus]|uniref:uncharacterized protein LOC105695372 n=1 Tax=Orussus abietinus TaxID=222816 RepID=UPI0006262EB0|nr:uncharacterized protein LOC105695372 [Orussus abietinus]
MDELEEQCEDAVLEVCDARERYPVQCADELTKCLKLRTAICVEPVALKSIDSLETAMLSEEQKGYIKMLQENVKYNKLCMQADLNKLANVADKVNDLKNILEQIENDKQGEISKLLK